MKKKLKVSIIPLASFIYLICSYKIFALSEPVSTAVDTITLNKNSKLYMPSEIEQKCVNKSGICFPDTKLFLINKKIKYDFSKLISQWEGSFFIYFIKISPGKYFDDLDHDGLPEVAIFPMVAGNAPSAPALIVTVKGNKITHYGAGTFFWEDGKHVTNIIKGKKWE